MTAISIAINTYGYHGKGVEVTECSFERMLIQTFKDFQVVISDHSTDNEIQNLCDSWNNRLNIKYFRNEKEIGSPASNRNKSIELCDGDIIKLLDGDDFLYDQNSLQKIVDAFDDDTRWLASAYIHSNDRTTYFNIHYPTMNPLICVTNTIGSPTAIAFRRNLKDIPLFDTNLGFAYDCCWYYEMMKKFGEPKILNEITAVNYLWSNSITSSISWETIEKENNYILRKHGFVQ